MENKKLITNNTNVYDISLQGKRKRNEDRHFIRLNKDGKETKLNSIDIFGIFDGHGGSEISNFLVDNLPWYFLHKNATYPLKNNYTNMICTKLQEKISINIPESKHAGSTALLAMLYKNPNKSNGQFLNIVNVGDSRCILCKDNFAVPLTKDHKPHLPEEKARIKNLGGHIVFDGLEYRIGDLSVSRAFGDNDAAPYVTCTPEIFNYKLDKHCKFFVLFSDGILDGKEPMSNDDVVNYILENCYDETTTSRINKNVDIAKKLAEYVIKRGSYDNVSVIVVFLD